MAVEFDFDHTLLHSKKISLKELQNYRQVLLSILKNNNFSSPDSFILLPFKRELLVKIKKLNKELKPDLTIVVGIGGSNLGAWAVYSSIYGRYAELEEKKIFFADCPEPFLVQKILNLSFEFIKKKRKVCLVFVSKTGTTLESVTNFKILYSFLKKYSRYLSVVFISSPLAFDEKKLKELNFHFLEIPPSIVGRYSVFSAAALFPLSSAQIDIDSLLEGAKAATIELLEKNPSTLFNYSKFIYSHYPSRNIFVNFLFSTSLEKYGMWHNQLFAESLSKNFKGLSPISSIGPTDLHSLAQLYFGGPKDKIFSLLSIKKFDYDEVFSKSLGLFKDEEIFNSKSISHIYSSIFRGVKEAFIKNKLPFVAIELDQLDEYHLGYLMQFDMLKIIFSAKLFKVNPFDQPAVEFYKKEVKKFL
ncbi:MAG: hypothetical protein N3D10_02880 [Candidatus Micrarchaeota archaeon]|nr:hypothetical protein [Candidatus Micrarchaeota archaeon]